MTRDRLCRPHEHLWSRRQVLGRVLGTAAGVGAAGSLGFFNPAMAEELRRNDKQVLFVWLDGGMSQIESWDPKPNTEHGGPFRAISTSVPGVQFSELMPRSAKVAHHLAILRSLHTQDNSHSAGVARIQRGDPKNRGVVYPFFGSAVANLMGPTSSGLPPYLWVKQGGGGFKTEDAGFLGPKYGCLALGDGNPPENLLPNPALSAEDYAARDELRRKLNERYLAGRRPQNSEANAHVFDMAQELMKRTELFDDSKIDPRDVERYGAHDLGRHMLLARRLIEAGVRFVKVGSYHWDSHGDHFNAAQSLHGKFDQAFASLIEDLADRGRLGNVLVIAMSEFGRTPKVNSHVGRDHWPEAWSVAMAGGGLKSGAVVGRTTADGTAVEDREVDIGHLFHTWFETLGVPRKQMEYDNHGQPLPVAHEECGAVQELIA